MKTNGRIGELLGTPCFNDYEYGHRVIWPLLDYLGVPSQARRPQFQIENPFGDGLLRLDFLIHHGDEPPEYNTVDATLWLFHALAEYLDSKRDCRLPRRLLPTLLDIIEAHIEGTRYG